ncbi:HAMP domain-containing protein [Rubrobacter marinus]|uniref:histidine kinase n=1 Tax=Rubrobacter marinus TaxID=2653852 RepID=A0A6G8PT21_9ACTN|nr:ATP-binding protein [Rubrobacter marinus]QIN77473.1 HAMP domain-containing protein [Rubrobacter marinus]
MKAVRFVVVAALSFAAALGVTIAFAATLFGVPKEDLAAVALVLLEVGCGVGLAALFLMRPAVLGRIGGVRAQLLGAGLIGSLLLLGTTLLGSRAMFFSGHDLSILLTMLLFAALLAVGIGLYWAAPMARRIEEVREGTARLASGKLDTEVPVKGHDEVAGLAVDFNRMARRIREADERERAMEGERRELIAAVSHDLRTPLTAVRALLEAVNDGVAADPEVRERYLSSAQNEVTHLGRLVDDLFELAQIDAGALRLTLERASLHDLISDTLASFQPEADKRGVRLLGEFSDGIDPVLINPPKLQRVLHNLISNALRHTPSDGTIFLRVKPEGEEAVRVEVEDTGEGITPEVLPRVFERSFRGEESRARPRDGASPGAGLGLAIARGLIEAHGGSIRAESQTGAGSRFCFTLRRAS